MAAPVRIEAEAFADPRFSLLGHLAGYNADEALGRMARLWAVCTKRGSGVVTSAIVRACLGPSGLEAILGSELGEETAGGIRVKGATSERVGWYVPAVENRKALAQAAGKKRAANAPRNQRGQLLPSAPPADDQRNASGEPADDQREPASRARAPSRTQEKKEREDSLSSGMPAEAIELAVLLAARIEARVKDQPKALTEENRKGTIASWADAFRLAHVRDGRPWARIRAVLEWSQADAFWSQNIRSAGKLREKFEDLAARMDAAPQRHGHFKVDGTEVYADGEVEI